MTIHVTYLSQTIVRMNFEGTFDESAHEELVRCLDEQLQNAKRGLFYLIDVSKYEPKEAEKIANSIADEMANRGNVIQKIAFLFKKKKKIKNKQLKDKVKIFDSDFEAQSWISDQSRHGFLDHLSIESLVDR